MLGETFTVKSFDDMKLFVDQMIDDEDYNNSLRESDTGPFNIIQCCDLNCGEYGYFHTISGSTYSNGRTYSYSATIWVGKSTAWNGWEYTPHITVDAGLLCLTLNKLKDILAESLWGFVTGEDGRSVEETGGFGIDDDISRIIEDGQYDTYAKVKAESRTRFGSPDAFEKENPYIGRINFLNDLIDIYDFCSDFDRNDYPEAQLGNKPLGFEVDIHGKKRLAIMELLAYDGDQRHIDNLVIELYRNGAAPVYGKDHPGLVMPEESFYPVFNVWYDRKKVNGKRLLLRYFKYLGLDWATNCMWDVKGLRQIFRDGGSNE